MTSAPRDSRPGIAALQGNDRPAHEVRIRRAVRFPPAENGGFADIAGFHVKLARKTACGKPKGVGRFSIEPSYQSHISTDPIAFFAGGPASFAPSRSARVDPVEVQHFP